MKPTRRRFLGSMLAAPAPAQTAPAGLNVYFGDIHNHGNVGYAQGSLRRAFENARNHLDFFAYTPHAWWNDISH